MSRRDVKEWFWESETGLFRLSREAVAGRPRLANGRCWEPHVDLVEDEQGLLLRAEIAGVRGEDIQLHYLPERQSLVIRGTRNETEIGQDRPCAFHQMEIMFGDFAREIPLPTPHIDPQGIRATYRNGFLMVQIPKLDPSHARRTVPLRAPEETDA